jgi:hypothetical protein
MYHRTQEVLGRTHTANMFRPYTNFGFQLTDEEKRFDFLQEKRDFFYSRRYPD